VEEDVTSIFSILHTIAFCHLHVKEIFD